MDVDDGTQHGSAPKQVGKGAYGKSPEPRTPRNKSSESTSSESKSPISPESQLELHSEDEFSDEEGFYGGGKEETHSYRSGGYLRPLSEVRESPDGQLQWRRDEDYPWRNAVYHSTIREELIDEASQLGSYKYPRAKGKFAKNDVTSYLPAHEEWGKQRNRWPDIVLQYQPSPEYILGEKAGYWVTPEGWLVIDVHNNPILDWPGIPHTISSKIEPVFMEAYCRSNRQITQADLRARMVDDPNGGQYNGQGRDPIRVGNLSMKMTRFRSEAGCIAWAARKGGGSDALIKYMDRLLPQHCKDANSIRGFRNLHKHEIAEMRLNNVGMFLERTRARASGTKDMSEQRRTELYAKALDRYHHLKAIFDAENPERTGSEKNAKGSSESSGAETASNSDHSDWGNPYGITFQGLGGPVLPTRESAQKISRTRKANRDT